MQPDFLYDRRSSPLLPLTEGVFQFLHTSNDRTRDIAARGLRPAALGQLFVPSGKLVVGDPFAGLTRRSNPYLLVPSGRFPVWQTLADVSDEQSGSSLRAAYLSLVFQPQNVLRRWQWQQARVDAGLSPALPAHALSYLAFHVDHTTDEESDEDVGPENAGFVVRSGTAAMVDAELFATHMPDDSPIPEQGWYDRLFEQGVPGSWFDRMDFEEHHRRGAANIPLPGAPIEHSLVLSQSGFGDHTYTVFGEYAFDYSTHTGEDNPDDEDAEGYEEREPALVALHLDFRVVPFDPHRPPIPYQE